MHRIVRVSLCCALIAGPAALAQSTRPAMSPVPPMASPMPSPMMPAATAPATQSADEAAVKAALADYNAAVSAADVPTLSAFISTSTEAQKKALALMGRLTDVGRKTYKAVAETFGEKTLGEDDVNRQSFPAGFPSMPIDMLDVRPAGEGKVTLVNRASAEAPPLAMKKVDGKWKLDGDALLPPMTDKQLTEQTQVLDAAINAIDETAGDVKANHFRTPDEAVIVMNHRVQKAVRAAQMKLAPIEDPAMNPATQPVK